MGSGCNPETNYKEGAYDSLGTLYTGLALLYIFLFGFSLFNIVKFLVRQNRLKELELTMFYVWIVPCTIMRTCVFLTMAYYYFFVKCQPILLDC